MKRSGLTAALFVLSSTCFLNVPIICAQEMETESHARIRESKDQAGLLARHHYDSPAERANDALVMTEIAAALKDEGLTDDNPIVIDSDHGRVTLSGVVV